LRLITGVIKDENFDIVKCNVCQFIYADQQPNRTFLDTLYDEVIDLNSQSAARHYRNEFSRRCHYLACLARLLEDQTDGVKALDFGAGFGQTSKLMSAQNIDVIAFETSALRQQQLQDMSIKVACSTDEMISAGPYDVVICDNVLEHVANPKECLKLFRSVMQPNAVLFISVPSYEPSQITSLVQQRDMSLNPWEHLNYFSLAHLDKISLDCGFSAISTSHITNNIDIGLRAETTLLPRLKNSAASALRLIQFVLSGTSVQSVNNRFYRCS